MLKALGVHFGGFGAQFEALVLTLGAFGLSLEAFRFTLDVFVLIFGGLGTSLGSSWGALAPSLGPKAP